MDLVEARRKAKLQKSRPELVKEAPGPEKTPKVEKPLAPKVEPKKSDKGAYPKTAKPAKTKQRKSSKAEAAVQVEPKKPEKPAAQPSRAPDDLFVDTNFGEDLPELSAAEKDLNLEGLTGAGLASKQEAAVVRHLTEEIAAETDARKAATPVAAPEPLKTPQAPADALESEKDFYDMVVEDLVRYGYGQTESEKNLVELLSFRLGDEIYAVSLTRIQQIIKPRPVTLVPGSPDYILGIISLRGMVIPVFDLRKRLKIPVTDPTRQSRIIIIKLDSEVLAGILVDQVREVARVPAEAIEATPSVFGQIEGEFLEGIARHKNQMMIVLNLSQVILGRKANGKAE